MKRLTWSAVVLLSVASLVGSPSVEAQRRIIGATEDADDAEDDGARESAPPGKDKKAKDARKRDASKDKPGDASKEDAGDASKNGKSSGSKEARKSGDAKDGKDGGASKDDKKSDSAKDKKTTPTAQDPTTSDAPKGASDAAAAAKGGSVAGVPDGAAEEQARRAKEAEAQAAAARAAEARAEAERKKQEDEQRRLMEEKRALEEKRRRETADQRLAIARKVRTLTRAQEKVGVSIAIEPGEVKANQVVELRVDVVQKLEEADPRFGAFAPIKGLALQATVRVPTAKRDAAVMRYALHPLDGAGRYGFHFTPPREGQYLVTISGGKGAASVEASFPVHVGVWPPPDFEDEENNNATSIGAARGGRPVVTD